MTPLPRNNGIASRESLDGVGAADNDQPYRFGWRPSTSTPYPFSTREYARLLVLRSRLRDRRERPARRGRLKPDQGALAE